jgi:hypothetical protein
MPLSKESITSASRRLWSLTQEDPRMRNSGADIQILEQFAHCAPEEISDLRDCAENFHECFMTLYAVSEDLEGEALDCLIVSLAHHAQDEQLSRILSKTGHVNCVDWRGHTALQKAVKAGHEQTVSLLLRCGADTEACDWLQESPLFVALKLGHASIARLLLSHGAKLPVHEAASAGNIGILNYLRDSQADLDVRNSQGDTPLLVESLLVSARL